MVPAEPSKKSTHSPREAHSDPDRDAPDRSASVRNNTGAIAGLCRHVGLGADGPCTTAMSGPGSPRRAAIAVYRATRDGPLNNSALPFCCV